MKGLDLRAGFAEILKDHGHDVLLLHADKRVKCPRCWSSVNAEPLSDCPYCLGTGYAYRLSRRRTRTSPLTISYNSMGAAMAGLIYQQVTGPANMRSDIDAFYFTHDTDIGVDDYILTCTFKNGRVKDITGVYQVMRYDLVRGDRGRVEYIHTVCVLKPEELERIKRVLRQRGGADSVL